MGQATGQGAGRHPPARRVAYLACLRSPGLGDLLQRNIFLGVLRRAMPDATLTLVAPEPLVRTFGEVLSRHLLADEVLACPDPARPARWAEFTRTLSAARFDACAVDPDSAVLDAGVAQRAGIPVRIALPPSPGDGAVTHPLRLGPPLFGRPDLFEYASALAQAVGLAEPLHPQDVVPRLRLYPDRVPAIVQPRPVVALHPGGAPHWNRRWPLERFAELGARLSLEHAASLVLVGDAAEEADLRRLAERVHRSAPAARIRSHTDASFNHLATLLAGVDVLAGNDSGPAHVAAAVGTPTVVAYGPTGTEFMWARVYPRHRGVSLRYPCQRLANLPGHVETTPCAHACVRRYMHADGPYPRCLADLPTDLVLEAVARQLAPATAHEAGDR